VIDSHCHLADQAFADDLALVVGRARAAGLAGALCILSADEPEELVRAQAVRAEWNAVQFAAAIHPHRAGTYAERPSRAAVTSAAALAAAEGVAVGEIGLDYHYDFAPREVQREVFAAQVALAVDRDLPVIIHTREATDDTWAVLDEAGRGAVRGVLHCFTGSQALAQAGLDLGLHVSLAGIVTFPRADALRETVRTVPIERMLVETDSPFLAPVPHRGKRNEPAHVARVLDAVAGVVGVRVDELSAQTTRNFHALFAP
jgi:TatD DNase family protein